MSRGRPGAAVSFLDGRDSDGKENSGLLDHGGPFVGPASGKHFGDQDLLMKLGQIERLQADVKGVSAEASRVVEFCPGAGAEMIAQRGLVALGYLEFAFHAFRKSLATLRTDLAD